MRTVLAILASRILPAVLHAQVYVVAASGGGQFTDLPAAVAAVPDGATLHVQPGTYSEFTITGKSLTILATPGAVTVNVLAKCAIQGLGAAQRVHVSGLILTTPTSPATTSVTVVSCAGSVVLDAITIPAPFFGSAPKVLVSQCADVHLHGWRMPSGVSGTSIADRIFVTASNVELFNCQVESGAPALRVQTGSFVALVDCRILGAAGRDTVLGSPGSPGSDAMFLGGGGPGATAHFFGATTIAGGRGGFQSPSIPTPCNGGNGLVASSATVRAFGTVFTGGAAGGGSGATAGAPIVASASTIEQKPGQGPSAALAGTMAPGNLVNLQLRGSAGAGAVLLLDTTTVFARPFPVALGALCVTPTLVVDGMQIPASGQLVVPVQLPTSWPRDSVVFGKFLILDPALNEVQASNALAAVTL